MLNSLTALDKHVLYHALLHAIRTDFRMGFHNTDTGHPTYHVGVDGVSDYADGPEKNSLYKVMHEISMSETEWGDSSLTIHEPVLCWADFCRIVCDAHEKNRKSNAA
jgi:hypothetical protein